MLHSGPRRVNGKRGPKNRDWDETGPVESVNCSAHHVADRDTHIALVLNLLGWRTNVLALRLPTQARKLSRRGCCGADPCPAPLVASLGRRHGSTSGRLLSD